MTLTIQQTFYDILKEENRRGTTIFLSSHILSEVQKLCDRAAILKEGKLISIQSIKELRESGYKKISVTVKNAIPNNFFNLSGIANYSENADKTFATFMYNGNISAVVDKIHTLTLEDVFLEEPSLEEIFLHFYNPPFCERHQCVMKHWLTFAFLFYLPSDTILL